MYSQSKTVIDIYKLMQQSQQSAIPNLQQAFNRFDKDGVGSIEIEEFSQILSALGENLSQDQLDEITSALETREYGRISFEQFQFWWKNGYKGPLGSLVYLRSTLRNKVSKLLAKYAEANLDLRTMQQTDKVNRANIQVDFKGEANEGLKIKGEVQLGKKGAQKSKELLDKYGLNKDSLNVLIVLTVNNQGEAKQGIQKLIHKVLKSDFFHTLLSKMLKSQQVSDKLKEMSNDYFVIKAVDIDSKIAISIQVLPNTLKIVQTPIQIIQHALSQIKSQIILSAQASFISNFSLDDLFQKSLIEALLMGANLKVNCQVSQALALKLREYLFLQLQQAEGKLASIFIILFKGLRLKFNLNSPSSIEKFFQKMGIAQLLQQIPTLPQILEQVSMFGAVLEVKQNQQHFLHIIYEFLQYLNKHSVENYELYVQYQDYYVSTEVALPDYLKIFKIIFNQI